MFEIQSKLPTQKFYLEKHDVWTDNLTWNSIFLKVKITLTDRIQHKITAKYFDIFFQKILNIIPNPGDYNIAVQWALIAVSNLTNGLHFSRLHPRVFIVSDQNIT